MVSRREWYERVNAAWPSEVPALTAEEAVRAARKLWRWGMGRRFTGRVEVTSGNRRTWTRSGTLLVNPGHGWVGFIHDMSHLLWWAANDSDTRPHEKGHAKLELAMRKLALRRGWLDGKLRSKPKPPKPPVDQRAEKLSAIVVRMDRWLAKKRRAERALAKLARQRRRLERQAA